MVIKDLASTPTATGAEDVAVTLATRLGLFVAGIAIQSLLAYTLLPTGRGAFAVCMLFAGILGVVLTPGADAGAQYYVIARRISVSQGISVSLTICVVGAVLAIVLAIPLINSDIAFFQKADTGSFYLALGLIPLSTFSGAVQHQLAGLRRYKKIAIYSLIQTITNVVGLVTLVVGLNLSVNGALMAIAVSYLVMIVISLVYLRRREGLTWAVPRLQEIARILQYGVKYHGARIGSTVEGRVGILVLGVMADSSEVGIFAVASGVVVRIILLSSAVAVPLLPRTTRHVDGHPELVAFCARIVTGATAAAGLLLVVFCPYLVRIMLSAAFLPAVPLIRITCIGIVLFAGTNALTEYFRGINRPDVCSWSVGAGLCCNLAVVPLLYGEWGVDAAAWGLTVSLFVRSALLRIAFSRMSRTRLIDSLVVRRNDLIRFSGSVQSVIKKALHRTID